MTAPVGVEVGTTVDAECHGASCALGTVPACWSAFFFFFGFFFLAVAAAVATALTAALATEACGASSTAALSGTACSRK